MRITMEMETASTTITMGPGFETPGVVAIIEAYASLPDEKRTLHVAMSLASLMKHWAGLTEEQRELYIKAINGLAIYNTLSK